MKTLLQSQRGVALVQVLVMSVVLLVMATGVMRMIFGTHVMTARAKKSDDNKMWVESCMAQKNESWAGVACNGAGNDSCDFGADGGPTVDIVCAAGQATYTVTW